MSRANALLPSQLSRLPASFRRQTASSLRRFSQTSQTLRQSSQQFQRAPGSRLPKLLVGVSCWKKPDEENKDCKVNNNTVSPRMNICFKCTNVIRLIISFWGDKVIIVIGGDDNYEDDGEGNRVVLSRWSKRKIFSQFNGEYLDGRKSFIFSWNTQHREIHEKALLHYFDSNKKGQKFEPRLIVDKVTSEAE